jgi:hypothetical protein
MLTNLQRSRTHCPLPRPEPEVDEKAVRLAEEK